MGHTSKRLAPGFAALCEAVQVSTLPFLSLSPAEASKEVISVLEKVSGLDDNAWAALPPEAQQLFDAAAELTNNNKDPATLVIEVVANGQDTSADTKPDAPPAKVAQRPAAAPQTVKSASTGEEKQATAAPKGKPGGGARKNPATDWCRNYVVDHPDATAAQVLEECLKQDFPTPLSKGTVDAVVFEMRNALRILRERGKLKD